MKSMPVIASTLLVLGMCTDARAAEGFVCHGTEFDAPGGPTASGFKWTNEERFTCPGLGQVTIPQVYARGYRVVHLGGESSVTGAGTPAFRQVLRNFILVEKI